MRGSSTRLSIPFWAAGLLTLATACAQDAPTQVRPEPAPPEETPRDTTPVQGMDVARLYRLVDKLAAGRYGEVHSLLVLRNGETVIEEYFRGNTRLSLHSLQSVSKSFTSALVGIAIGRGDIESVDERVLDFFPQWEDDLGRNALRSAMRVEDILTMRTGTDYNEVGPDAPHWQLNRLPTGWDLFWLSRPMLRLPGTYWQYDSGGVIALSAMLKQRTGYHADHLADQWLFGPLGIVDRRWFQNQEGHPHTGGGLWLNARDMAKLGQLYLQGGQWEGEQVVPAAWVEASTRRHVTFDLPAGSTQRMKWYGYLWWILEPDPLGSGTEDIYAAIGAGGQFIFVIPEHDLVVGVTSSVESGRQWTPVEWLYSDVLPAVIR